MPGSVGSSARVNRMGSPVEKTWSVSKKTPEVLMFRVMPVPCSRSIGSAIGNRDARRRSTVPGTCSTLSFGATIAVRLKHTIEQKVQFSGTLRYIFLYLSIYIPEKI
jgi:hypothetical protein